LRFKFPRRATVAEVPIASTPVPAAPRAIDLLPETDTPIRLNKVCEAEDFRNRQLLDVMRRVFSHVSSTPGWPAGQEQRKLWEVAMAVATFERYHKLTGEEAVLGVGAGLEITTFYLTNFVKRVFATDLYASTDLWTDDAPPHMLLDPAGQSPIPCNPRRLVAQHMDGRNLLYEDDSFDAVYSSSSIEHFGDWDDVTASAREIGRVLKPGGILTLSTEYRVRGTGKGLPNVLMFSPDELQRLIIAPSGLRPVDEPSFEISSATMQAIVTQEEMDEFYREYNAGRPAQWKTFPQIVLETGEYRWTSFHLALRKPD
jgi:SAM-dependent methyltransferase